SHEQHPELLVAGAVVNGSTDCRIDEANFLIVHARNTPPRPEVPGGDWIPTPSNASYKRAAIPADVPRAGWLETEHNVALLHQGEVALDDRIVVRHVQSTGSFGTCMNHFHAGRSMGGLARPVIDDARERTRWALGAAAKLPIQLVRPVWDRRAR